MKANEKLDYKDGFEVGKQEAKKEFLENLEKKKLEYCFKSKKRE